MDQFFNNGAAAAFGGSNNSSWQHQYQQQQQQPNPFHPHSKQLFQSAAFSNQDEPDEDDLEQILQEHSIDATAFSSANSNSMPLTSNFPSAC